MGLSAEVRAGHAPPARRVGGACACRARSNGRRRPLVVAVVVVVVRTPTPNYLRQASPDRGKYRLYWAAAAARAFTESDTRAAPSPRAAEAHSSCAPSRHEEHPVVLAAVVARAQVVLERPKG